MFLLPMTERNIHSRSYSSKFKVSPFLNVRFRVKKKLCYGRSSQFSQLQRYCLAMHGLSIARIRQYARWGNTTLITEKSASAFLALLAHTTKMRCATRAVYPIDIVVGAQRWGRWLVRKVRRKILHVYYFYSSTIRRNRCL